jgi:hypothetical protein
MRAPPTVLAAIMILIPIMMLIAIVRAVALILPPVIAAVSLWRIGQSQ